MGPTQLFSLSLSLDPEKPGAVEWEHDFVLAIRGHGRFGGGLPVQGLQFGTFEQPEAASIDDRPWK
jgi:hypothetical protein